MTSTRLPLTTPAIVLRVVDYGEADRVVTLLSRELGKVAALARGARRPSGARRFGAGLALYGVGEATLRDKPGAELATLDGFHGAAGFARIGLDVVKVGHAGYVCELVSSLAPPRQPEPELFALALRMLTLLDERPPRAETLRAFELQLLEAVGLRPTLDRCLSCGRDDLGDDEEGALDIHRGGLICAACRAAGALGRVLPASARRALLAAQEVALEEAPTLAIAGAVNATCRELLGALVEDHVGRPLKSRQFLAKLAEAGG